MYVRIVTMMLLGLLLAPARAAESEALAERLAGDVRKTWILVGIDRTLGEEESCTSGEEYTFFAGGSYRIDRCVDGRIRSTTGPWTVHEEGIDVFVTLGEDDAYRAIHSRGTNALGLEQEELILRREVGKDARTVDLRLVHTEGS